MTNKERIKALIVVAIFILLLIGLTSVLKAQTVNLLNIEYNEEDCQSTWRYEICNTGASAISHFLFKLCDHTCIMQYNENTGEWEGNGLLGYTSNYEYTLEWGKDGSTGKCGLKFDEVPEFEGCDTIALTVTGIPKTGNIGFLFKTGEEITHMQVPGPTIDPDCDCSVLPVGLISFNVQEDLGIHVLTWTVEYETPDFSHFIVEHSIDAYHFIEKANISGGRYVYEFQFIPMQGNNYYRLRMVDENGSESFSKIIGMYSQHDLFANPKVLSQSSELGVYDHMGREVDLLNSSLRLYLVRWKDKVYQIIRIK